MYTELEIIFGFSLMYCFAKLYENRGYINTLANFSYMFLRKKIGGTSELIIDGNYCRIPYMYNGREYNIYLPYDENKIFEMTNVELSVGKELLKIQPGVVQKLTSKMFNGEKILYYNSLENRELYMDEISWEDEEV